MADRNLFTPREFDSDKRLRLHISAADDALIGRGAGWRATVTDLDTGKRFLARAAACSLPHCFCDAVAVEIKD